MLHSFQGFYAVPISSRWIVRSLTAIAMGVLSALMMSCGEDPESPGAKSENSALESAAVKYRTIPRSALEFMDLDEYHFVRVQSEDDFVWIMLNPRYPPFYKQLPWNRTYALTQQQFEEIEKRGMATLTVTHCLASHVQERPNH